MPKKVTPIMPLKTAVPSERCISQPAPVVTFWETRLPEGMTR